MEPTGLSNARAAWRAPSFLLSVLFLLGVLAPALAVSETKSAPFSAANVEKACQGRFTANGTANGQTGMLEVTADGSNYGGGEVLAFVRWTYTHPAGAADEPAIVTVNYEVTQHQGVATATDPTSASAVASLAFGVRVVDAASGSQVVMYPIETYADTQVFIPVTYAPGFRGQDVTVRLKPGRTYHIDAYLRGYASVYAGQGQHLGVAGNLPPPGGEAFVVGKATVTQLRIQTRVKPWVRVSVDKMFTSSQDTWDLYEWALKNAGGKEYRPAGAWVSVSAGGDYDAGQSGVTIEAPFGSRLLGVRGGDTAGLAINTTSSGDRMTVSLPDPNSLPLAGRTWRFLVAVDPEYQLRADSRSPIAVPFFGPVFRVMAQNAPATRTRGAAGGARRAASGGKLRVPATDLCSLAGWYIIVPASVVAGSADRGEVAAGPQWCGLAIEPPSFAGWQGIAPPQWYGVAPPGFAWFGGRQPELGGQQWEWVGREPGIVISLRDLWRALAGDPAKLQVEISPRMERLLRSLETFCKEKRDYLNSLCFQPKPNGPVYRLPDLPNVLQLDPGGQPVTVPDPESIPVPSPGGFRLGWRVPEFAWQSQPQTLKISGNVRGTGQYADVWDAHSGFWDYKVYFDFVPAREPTALVAPAGCLDQTG